jgi:hypothetical protein
MTRQSNHLSNDLTTETWKEELSRAKKFQEATQKRSEEKRAHKEKEKNTERRTRSAEQ